MSSLLSHQWLRCNSCTWAYDEQCSNRKSCAEAMICHIAIVVASRAHCFHDCINLAPREILKTLLFPLMTKRCAGNVAVIAYIHRCYIYHYYYYLFIIIIYLLLYIIILYIMLFIFVKDININNQLSLHGVSLVLPNLLFYM